MQGEWDTVQGELQSKWRETLMGGGGWSKFFG